ncbi:hypothetical protein [Ruegeria sp. Alg231-54]|uniref:hypothetical protein n=1 Tax=Ruegeria sp. Alg231-54 TaxID=1922221 RepID=UPI00131F176D|nr:hypothetical protein [Ruegeria sp. Alg231-54]
MIRRLDPSCYSIAPIVIKFCRFSVLLPIFTVYSHRVWAWVDLIFSKTRRSPRNQVPRYVNHLLTLGICRLHKKKAPAPWVLVHMARTAKQNRFVAICRVEVRDYEALRQLRHAMFLGLDAALKVVTR